MRSIRAGALAYAALGAVAPGVTGRLATDAFGTTRALGLYPDDVVPLGARRFPIEGHSQVRGGYVWGDAGPTALLVHGWGTDSSSMHALVPSLRRLGLRVAAFDAPAHGVSEGSQTTVTQFTGAVGAALDALGDVRVVVAHSLGSITTVAAVAGRPQLPVTCLVLVSPTCTLTGVLERWQADRRLTRPVVELIYQELWRRNGVPVRYWDIASLGQGVDVPTLVLHDPDDPVVPFSEGEAVAATLPAARLEAVRGAGHLGILAATELRERIAAFVAERGGGAGRTRVEQAREVELAGEGP